MSPRRDFLASVRRPIIAMIALLASGFAVPAAQAAVKLPAIFSDNMVLQRDRPLSVWGTATPGETVTVELAGHEASSKAEKDGTWHATLPAMAASAKPLELTVSGKDGHDKLTVKNILVGEVWVASGQSNMAFPLKAALNAKKELAEANHPELRMFQIPLRLARQPATDVAAHWVPCSPESAATFTAVGYFFGRHLLNDLKVPIGIIADPWGGQRIELFTPAPAVISIPELKGKTNKTLATIYNGMVAPITPYTIRGVIWYQGESNRRDGFLYYHRMRALIAGWRHAWGEGDIPFYFVQLAPWEGYKGDELTGLWEAQTAALGLANTGMVVTNDIATPKNIHPPNKQEVGRRLALWALARTYGHTDVEPSGPLFKSMKVEGNKIRVQFAHLGGGLASRDGKPLTEFEIAGADGKFVPAHATIDGDSVLVQSEAVKRPKQVRFAWKSAPTPNLMNKAGLPAAAFRSQDWRGATAERSEK